MMETAEMIQNVIGMYLGSGGKGLRHQNIYYPIVLRCGNTTTPVRLYQEETELWLGDK